MKDSVKFNTTDEIIGEKVGTISVSMYKDIISNKNFFYLQSENEDMLQVSYVIEDTLKMF